MPLPNRAEVEAEIARKLGRVNQQVLKAVMDALGDPPIFENLTSEVWQDITNRYKGVLLPEVERVFEAAAETLLGEIGIGVQWTLINERAADWASRYGFDLISRIDADNRNLTQKAVANFYRQNWNLGDLKRKLQSVYGPVRAEMIAVTETTRASVEGERAYVDELRKQGAKLVGVWRSSADDRVCPICSPRDGTIEGKDWTDFPPTHIRCRCWVAYQAIID